MVFNGLLSELYDCYRQDLQLYQEWAAFSDRQVRELENWGEQQDPEPQEWAKVSEPGREKERLVEALQLSAVRSAELRERICRELNITHFGLKELAKYVSDPELTEWHTVVSELIEAVKKARQVDEAVTARLEAYQAATKLELGRVQCGTRLRQAYRNIDRQVEPRFVDKNK